jgi:serine/threonine protein kinase
MVLFYCKNDNLRNYLNNSVNYIGYMTKIYKLFFISRGLLDIHNAGKVHKDFHSGNILFFHSTPFISDLGMCQPANNKRTTEEEGINGVLPYMAPEVLRGHKYTKASDIYSFGIIMNEFLSEEIPYSDISHDEFLAIKICEGLRPKISKNIPNLFADLIMKCWSDEAKNRPSTKELYEILLKWKDETKDKNTELYFQIKECDKISKSEFKNRSYKGNSKNIQTHPQATYTSRLLNFNNLPEQVSFSGNLSCYLTLFMNKSILIYFNFLIDDNYKSQLTNPSKYSR